MEKPLKNRPIGGFFVTITKNMNITKLNNIKAKDYKRIMQRSVGQNTEILPNVQSIMNEVREKGDLALLEMIVKRFGAPLPLQITTEEIDEAYGTVDADFISGIRQMKKNIASVHKAQLPRKVDTTVYPETGIKVYRVWRPIDKVGLYIPGGKAIYPSSVLMSAIPAQIAGCQEIIMCSPARNRKIPAPTLVAANEVGIKKIYKIGGAEAIAAMAYGTTTIPQVYKIFGAGNASVTAAKILAMQTVSIDMPAGPSEVFIIADETANPAYIAADLLADGEHGEDSACVLLTTSQSIAEQTIREIKIQTKKLYTKDRILESLKRYGLVSVVNSIDEAINFCNEYAPEHLELMTKNPESVLKKITNAGSVFLGDWSTKSSGDYATGANHVLPTGGFAKMYPPLGVDSFGKWMQVQKCTKKGLFTIKKSIETVATVEQLPAHANATSIRFGKGGQYGKRKYTTKTNSKSL